MEPIPAKIVSSTTTLIPRNNTLNDQKATAFKKSATCNNLAFIISPICEKSLYNT